MPVPVLNFKAPFLQSREFSGSGEIGYDVAWERPLPWAEMDWAGEGPRERIGYEEFLKRRFMTAYGVSEDILNRDGGLSIV